ncbi:MAG: tyrosine recombinase XerC [Burkholderiaceae bacterium]
MRDWLQRLRTERGYSPATLTSYAQGLELLALLAEDMPWERVREADVRQWVGEMAREGLAPRTIAQRLSAWRGFFDHLALAHNPARVVRAPKAPRRLPKALSPDEANRLAAHQPDERFESVRDKALVELFYSSGLRLAELCSLDVHYFADGDGRSISWLERAEAQVRVTGKGGKQRHVPVGSAALAALDVWLELRQIWLAAHPGAESRALFLSLRGRRLARRSVQLRIATLARRQGIPSRVHPHVLRHSFASHLLQSSGDLRGVQELLGHANIATTQVYTALDFQRLATVYDAAHPRAKRR